MWPAVFPARCSTWWAANRSGAVFAINKDKNAPVFKQCDYGLVGDIKDVLPALTAAL